MSYLKKPLHHGNIHGSRVKKRCFPEEQCSKAALKNTSSETHEVMRMAEDLLDGKEKSSRELAGLARTLRKVGDVPDASAVVKMSNDDAKDKQKLAKIADKFV